MLFIQTRVQHKTAGLPLLCFDRIIIPGQQGFCKNTNTSVVFICLRLVALSFFCFFIFRKAALYLSLHQGNLLGNLAFQSAELNICITQTNSVSIWAEMWVLSEHWVQLAVFSFFFLASPCYSHRDTKHTLIQILLKKHCSKNVPPLKNDERKCFRKVSVGAEPLWEYAPSVCFRIWVVMLFQSLINGTTGWRARAFGHNCSISYWFYCGWTVCRKEEYIYM